MERTPLVSICVLTYNSSQYVVETLDSAWAQTYPNVEIIITDDCSTDTTVNVCKEWMASHQDEKRPVILVEAEKNTGVSGNCNRGLKASRGEWFKVIAGDDMLAPTAIETYVKFVNAKNEVKHCIANAVHFTGQFKEEDLANPDSISPYMYRDCMTAKAQYRVITKTFFGSGPTYFINIEALRSVGGYDERFPMQEDYPLFIKMIGAGHKMYFLDEVTVYKRIVPNSVQYDRKTKDIFPKNKVRMIRDWRYEYKMEVLGPIWRLLLGYSLWLQNTIIKCGNSYNSIKCQILFLFYRLTDPFGWCERWLSYKNSQYLQRHHT